MLCPNAALCPPHALPPPQFRPFRHNMMALMTVTGAKGSVVNFSQARCWSVF